MSQSQAIASFSIIFYSLLFLIIVTVTDAYSFGNRNYIRFRRPEDIWEPPFRTVLCDDNYPIRIRIDADPATACQYFMNYMKHTISYDQ